MKKLIFIMALIVCASAVLFITDAGFSQTESETSAAASQPTAKSESDSLAKVNMDKVGNVLFVFLVLSVVFEVALSPVFNWSVFLANFDGKGYKTPITIILAFIVFWGYDLDIISDLLKALNRDANMSLGGQIITAFLIAGGSSGVFQIFKKLKIRMDDEERLQRRQEVLERRAETVVKKSKK